MEKQIDFGVGLDLTLNIYSTSHTFMIASHHRSIVEILTDDILLEVFDWYRQTLLEQWTDTWKMGYAGARVQKMAIYRIWVAMPSGFVCSPCTYGTPVRRRDWTAGHPRLFSLSIGQI